MAAHNVLPQLFYSGAWQVIPADVWQGSKIKTTRGVTDDGEPRPARIEWTFNNATDAYRPSNPTSPLYGLLTRNMPVAVTADGAAVATCEAASFSPDQSPGFDATAGRGIRWVDMVATGQLDRITSWDDPVRSPMFRQISRYTTLRAYAPLEDARGAQAPVNEAPSGGAAFGLGVSYAADDGPAGAGTAVAMTATSRLGVPVRTMSSTAGWQVFFSALLDAAPSATLQPLIGWTMANGDYCTWDVNATTFRFKVTASDGTILTDTSVGFGTGAEPWLSWMTYRFKVTQSGANVNVEVSWYPQSGAWVYGYTPVYAGSVSRPTNLRIYGNANIDGALYSHVGVVATVVDNLTSYDFVASFDGYRGELAGNRYNRLCDQLGIARTMVGSAADTWPMGPQKPETAIALLKECVHTDDALLYDRLDSLGLVFRTRTSMLNQAAKLALSFATDIAPPMVERIDTADVANTVTVSQRNGSSSTATLTSGPLSTLAPPNGIGVKKGSVDVNVSDETTLATLAGWHLSRRTILGSRYDQVTIDCDAHALVTESFEFGIAGWSPSDINTLAQSSAQARTGSFSALLTVVGAPATAYARKLAAAVAGQTHTLRMWVRSPTALPSVVATFDGLDSSFAYVGGAATAPVALVANTWTLLPTLTWSPPAGVAWINYGPTVLGSPVAGTQLFFDDVDFIDPATAVVLAIGSVDAGDRITVSGRDPEPIELIVYGIGNVIEDRRRLVTFTCVPGAVYQAGVYDAATSRYDVTGSTLAAGATSTATSWSLTAATADDVWSTTALPYEWLVAGERVRVTAMTAPAGAGPYTQTATVVRSVNGVVKAQSSATSVRMAPRTDTTAGAVRWAIRGV